MTRKEQVKILDDKIKANNVQYDLDRMNAEISAYSSGDLPKYENLTKKDLGYKPDAVEKVKIEYSPIGKIFTNGLAKEDKSKKVGLFKRLKNIEDNLVEVDDNDNKAGIFRIIKNIKDRGIKIDNDDEAMRENREHKKDLGYKPDAVEKVKIEYSPIGKIFTNGLAKEDKSKKVGLFKRLKNIEDNLVEVDDNDNKAGIFRIIKNIKDRGIKIDNDDEAIRENRERIKELIDDGVKVNNFDEMKEEIIDHIKNLKAQGINVKVDEDQINDLINKISDIKNKDKKIHIWTLK